MKVNDSLIVGRPSGPGGKGGGPFSPSEPEQAELAGHNGEGPPDGGLGGRMNEGGKNKVYEDEANEAATEGELSELGAAAAASAEAICGAAELLGEGVILIP